MKITTTVRSRIIVMTQGNIKREISGKYVSNCDYYFIIKDLAEEFEGQFECLGENTQKDITISVLIKKETENGNILTKKVKEFEAEEF